jgi:wyosine [tRNA(Phe)-imidazoG37] synthetase (radical SAM superfamily)
LAPRFLFGPVKSRRLGWSLGIDLVPFKTCSFDCGFCQVGATTGLTLERREYVPTAEVIAELSAWCASGGRADYLTLSGAGEPTLHSRFGDILRAVPAASGVHKALLSNGSLFYLPEVRLAAQAADVVKVSFSAWDEDSFRRLNRPHSALRLASIAEGIRTFRQEYVGTLWVEVFLARGINDQPDQVARIADLVRTFAPNQIQLNTVVRPPTDSTVGAVEADILAERAHLFEPCEVVCAGVPVETLGVPGRKEGKAAGPLSGEGCREQIFGLVQRHPSTVEEIAQGLGLDSVIVRSELELLQSAGRIEVEHRAGRAIWNAALIPPTRAVSSN